MISISVAVPDPTLNAPVLLSLDPKLEQTGVAKAECGHFDGFMRHLQKLDKGHFPGSPMWVVPPPPRWGVCQYV
ncbi:unnamed protein product [Taenia asiatica]|uniref:Uncharacterized protein n=1 Tax=Taenia asiatica TaxID=60517 RepID=A0A0R3W8Z1_TAEAS|nr:unnamed protein product [Taenia asiatica]